MAENSREEDLSELDGADAVCEKIRSLIDDGWKPTTLTLVKDEEAREQDPEDNEGQILRDEPRF
jgi:hypothetical protein